MDSPSGSLGWDLLISQLALKERVWEEHCREEENKLGGLFSFARNTSKEIPRSPPAHPQHTTEGKVSSEHPVFIEN